jgi:hypothetical protein
MEHAPERPTGQGAHQMAENIGPCPLCVRDMYEGTIINRHHLIPKSLGGKEQFWIHVVCHTKIHSVFSLRELLHHYHTWERLLDHDDIAKFVKWVQKKDPEFKTKHSQSKRKRR